jgi:hypothetical protein
VAPHRHAQRADRGGLYGPLAGEGVRPSATSKPASTPRTTSCSTRATARSSSPAWSSRS